MELNFIQSAEKQKIVNLEKNLQVLKEQLKTSSIAFGNKLLNESDNLETKELVRSELINNWKNNLSDRKNKTDKILKIKSTREREQQLKNLHAETENIIETKNKSIEKLKAEFSFLAYKNHREDFSEVIERLPELSKIEANIIAEKNKIDSRKLETQEKGFFQNFIPTVQNILSKGKVSSSENKLKKIIFKNSEKIFSDEDFESLCNIIDELPDDLAKHISQIKKLITLKTTAEQKLLEIQQEENLVKETLKKLEDFDNSKTNMSVLMKEIEILDEKIEANNILTCDNCVDKFFDQSGHKLKEFEGNLYTKEIANIGNLRKKCFVGKIEIQIAEFENEIKLLEKKIQTNAEKITRAEKQIKTLTDEIETTQNKNSETQLSITDFKNEIDNLKAKIE